MSTPSGLCTPYATPRLLMTDSSTKLKTQCPNTNVYYDDICPTTYGRYTLKHASFTTVFNPIAPLKDRPKRIAPTKKTKEKIGELV